MNSSTNTWPVWPEQSPDLFLIEQLWNELEGDLHAIPPLLTSVPSLTNALMDEWKQISRAIPKILCEPFKKISSNGGKCHGLGLEF